MKNWQHNWLQNETKYSFYDYWQRTSPKSKIAAIISLKNPSKKDFLSFFVFALSGEKVCFSYNHTFFRLSSLLVRPDVMRLFAPLSTPGGCFSAPFFSIMSQVRRKIIGKCVLKVELLADNFFFYRHRDTKATKCTYNQAQKVFCAFDYTRSSCT